MGREIRKVPPHWDHPKDERGNDQPMRDQNFEDAFACWLSEFDRIRMGNMSDFEKEWYPLGLREWLVDDGAPLDPAYYRPWKDEEATWFQVWETVSEGTPVSPPFATKEELVDYLVAHGDFWDQKRGRGGYVKEQVEKFVYSGYVPSMTVRFGEDGMDIKMGIDAA